MAFKRINERPRRRSIVSVGALENIKRRLRQRANIGPFVSSGTVTPAAHMNAMNPMTCLSSFVSIAAPNIRNEICTKGGDRPLVTPAAKASSNPKQSPLHARPHRRPASIIEAWP